MKNTVYYRMAWIGCRLILTAAVVGISGGLQAATPRAAVTNTAPQIKPSAPADYTAFKLITDRNIFNSRRSRGYVPTERGPSRPTRSRETFSLVGVMSYDKGPFAFFDGSSSEFRKALKPGDTIAGLTVQTIEPNRVTLGGATNHVELPIGKQLQKQDNGEWTVGDRTEYGTPPPVAAALTRPTYATNSASAAGTNPSSIVEGIQGALLELLSDGSEPPAPPAGSSAGSSTQPPAPSSGGASPDDILARLRARAAAERGDNP